MNGNFQELLKQYNHPGDKSKYYVDEMKGAITGLIANNNALALFQDNLTLVLHGSTARNIDDQFSDIDCWIVFDDAELMKFDELCEHRYIPFVLNGKPGHMDPISINELNSCFSRININLIHEIRDAGIIIDNKKIFRDIQTIAKKPMSDEVRYAFFFHNYVQMRSSHRALDNPLERQDEIASLIGIIHTIVFALRAGLILDKVPYPFDKWLYVVSHFHPIAKSLVAPNECQMGIIKSET